MWIQELNIKNFGKFWDKRIMLKPGINLIYGENESGKSTLHAFIRGCLFGIRKMRGRASKADVYSRYQPWENSAYYAGMLRFVCGGKVFRLERDFTKGVQAGVLVCETDGEKLSLENGDLEMLLGNVGEMAFDNTVSIAQLRSETDEGLAVELKNYMANVEGTGNASIRVEKALVLLKDKKKHLEKQIAEVEKREENKIRGIEVRIKFLMEEVEKEKRELEKENVRLKQLSEELESGDTHSSRKKEAQTKKSEKRGFFNRLIRWLKRLIAGLLGRKEDTGNTSEEIPETGKYRQRSKLLGKIEHLETQIQEKEILIENGRQEILMQKEMQRTEEKKTLQSEIEACNLAMARIQDVVAQMQINAGQFLKKRTSEIFSEITEGRYSWVDVQDNLRLEVHGRERFVPIEQLSRGTIWQLYFALRMAANEVLCQEEDLPVILDDAFVMYDDDRLGQVMNWLVRQKKQVLIFTCQKREKEWLLSTGNLFHEVNLPR